MKITIYIIPFFFFFHISSILAIPARAETPFINFDQNQNSEKISFETAENLFSNFEYHKALVQYKEYIRNFPDGIFLDDAIFRIGEIYRLSKNYFMAIRYYQLLQKIKEKTDWLNEAEYKIAVCYLQLGRYRNALQYLEYSYLKPNDQKRKWEIVFLTGRALMGMGNNISAFKKYLQSLKDFSDSELKQKSEIIIYEMIRNQLNEADLIYLSKTLPMSFPVGFILFKLSEIYEHKRDYRLYQEYLNRFINNFPNHDLYEKSLERLNSFLAKSNKIKTKIAAVLPLSGDAAANGQKILQGIQMAFNLIPDNKKNDIELIVKNSKGNPETVATIIEEIGSDNDVICVIGPMFSKTVEKAITQAEIFKIPIISPSASVTGLPDTSQYFFRNCLTQELQGKSIAEYAMNKLDRMKFAVLYSSDIYGSRLKDIFQSTIHSLGGEVLAEESYSPIQNDFKEQILKIGGMNDDRLKMKTLDLILRKKGNFLSEGIYSYEYEDEIVDENQDEELSTVLLKIFSRELDGEKEAGEISGDLREKIVLKPFVKVNYDAMFIPGYPDKIGLILPQLAFYNIENIQLLGGNGWSSGNFFELGGKYANGAIFVDGFFPGSYLSRVQEFNKLYENFFGETPDILSAQAFDAANIVLNIILNGKKDRKGMKEGLMGINNFKGVSGDTTILPNGDSAKSLFYIYIKNNNRIQIH